MVRGKNYERNMLRSGQTLMPHGVPRKMKIVRELLISVIPRLDRGIQIVDFPRFPLPRE